MKRKLFLAALLSVSTILNFLIPVYSEPENPTEIQQEADTQTDNSPAPHAGAAILVDLKSGKVLFSKNEDKKMYPASITKIMTALLALESGIDFQEVVTASREAIDPITNKHSHMGILTGEELTFENLIYGMMVYSANDAANVLAVRIGGSIDGFVQMMNSKAQALGAVNTHYANPHGFHDDNHYTTAADIAVIARYAMQNEKFREIVSTDMYTMPPTNKYNETRYLSSTNHLISRRRNANHYYKKAFGIKTGFTDEAGYCLASAAADGDTELLSVVLNCQNTYETGAFDSVIDMINLLDYVFDNFEYITVAKNGDIVSDSGVYEAKNNVRVALTPEQDIAAILPKDINLEEVEKLTTLNDEISAPISKGDILGFVQYNYKGETIGKANLAAVNDVEKDMIIAAIHLFVKIITHPVSIIVLLLFLYLIMTANIRRKKRRKKRRSKLKHVRN